MRTVSPRLLPSTTIDNAFVGRFVGGRVRIPNRLTALFVSRAKAKGMYPDGDGLYLQITAGGARSWIYRYMLHGRAREMGLGSLRDFSLADARQRAAECRKLRADGFDPIERRRAARDGQKLAATKTITFEEAAKAYIEANSPGWRSAKQAVQWTSSLKMYAYPVFGSLAVPDIDTTLVMKVLEPIWKTKTETASRVRGRIEAVLDGAWVPQHVPRLGGGTYELSPRGRRDGPCSRHRRQSGSCLSPRRPVRKAAAADAGLGELLQLTQTSRANHCDKIGAPDRIRTAAFDGQHSRGVTQLRKIKGLAESGAIGFPNAFQCFLRDCPTATLASLVAQMASDTVANAPTQFEIGQRCRRRSVTYFAQPFISL